MLKIHENYITANSVVVKRGDTSLRTMNFENGRDVTLTDLCTWNIRHYKQ